MKYANDRPFADPEKAARRLLEITSTVEPVQDGRSTCPSSEYKAGLDLAIASGWLWRHESGTFVRFTQAGAELFA
ncbi:hypothetical protein SAMN05443247_07671 [Bradyrhizobium erythrophlei]|jgi:hypothetical protein|nr:hypothetical protein SAMN05443247_07671 [Bradyrhizobium erythrophlei]